MAKKKPQPNVQLPAPSDLERICKGLAALEAMMSVAAILGNGPSARLPVHA